MKSATFWDVMTCSLIQVSKEHTAYILRIEEKANLVTMLFA
jgi:hypothetical protein